MKGLQGKADSSSSASSTATPTCTLTPAQLKETRKAKSEAWKRLIPIVNEISELRQSGEKPFETDEVRSCTYPYHVTVHSVRLCWLFRYCLAYHPRVYSFLFVQLSICLYAYLLICKGLLNSDVCRVSWVFVLTEHYHSAVTAYSTLFSSLLSSALLFWTSTSLIISSPFFSSPLYCLSIVSLFLRCWSCCTQCWSAMSTLRKWTDSTHSALT